MADPMPITSLLPELQQFAEQLLQHPLNQEETQLLLQFQQQLNDKAPNNDISVNQQARQQAEHIVAAGRAQAELSVKNILQSIQNSSNKALQLQQQEEQAIAKLVEGARSLTDLRPSALMTKGASASSQMALAQIADRLAMLAKQEVEKCFTQFFGPLSQELKMVIDRLNAAEKQGPAAAEPTSTTDPNPAASPQTTHAATNQ